MKAGEASAVATAAVVVGIAFGIAGCGREGAEKGPAEAPKDPEAVAFGYTGEDALYTTNNTFLVTGAAVTNWLPERVLGVVEKYEFSQDEKALLGAAGVVTPCDSFKEPPDGYAKESEEPWFTLWTKKTESFGLSGKAGVMTHYNEDLSTWESSETYFSSYWPTREAALEALAGIRAEIGTKYNAKKFYELADGGWLAEYVRLCVMGVVGQKPDGTWSCMLDLRDKCRTGCGPWEPVEEQAQRRNQYEYSKAMRAWKAEVKSVLARNEAAVAAAAAERGLAGFPDAQAPVDIADGRRARIVSGVAQGVTNEADVAEAMEALWAEKVALLESAIGVKPVGEVGKRADPAQGCAWMGEFSGDLYDARLDVFMPAPPPPPEAGAEGEAAAEAEAAPAQWRIVFAERLQDGLVIPERPQPAK